MLQKNKTNFLFKLLACVAVFLFTLTGAIFALPSVGKTNISASAETVEYMDLLAVENRSWGAASDEYYFGGYTIGASTTDNAHWLNTDASVNGCWYNGNDALITANNGVDILQYIYINDTSARDAITANLNAGGTLVGSNGWLTNPAASPVYVETTNGSGLLIKILKAYAGESYTLTFKAGFSLIKNDGNVLYVSDDVVYNCVGNAPTRVEKSTVTFQNESSETIDTKRVVNGQAIGELPEVPAKDGYVGFWTVDGAALTENTVISTHKTATPVYGLEYQDLLGLEDRTSWGAHDGEYYFGGVTMEPFGYFNTADSVSNPWYVGNTTPITANNGVDIMEYIYVNGTSARALITANANGDRVGNSCDCWLSNPAACPVYVETTNGSGIMIRLLKSAFGDTVTLTFKKGFSLIRNDGEVIYVSSDITYTYENGAFTSRVVDKEYKLSFEGTSETKTLKNNQAIGELPAVPAKDGCEGVWTIDGVEITADTAYNYGANKTAVVVYSKDITETIGLGDWGVPETESDIRYLWIQNGGADIPTAYPNSYWNDHADNKDSNYGVDIMEYILIDGESARSIINANAAGTTSYKAASTFPLNNGGCYAPVCIETAGTTGIRFKVMVDYKTSFKVTFKAGFTLVNTDGVKLYTSKDVTYNVGATMGDITAADDYIEYKDLLGLEDRAWGAHDGEYYFGGVTLDPFAYFNTAANVSGCWYVGNSDLISANNGLDIMEYIYINDTSARALITANVNGDNLANSCSCWLSNAAAYPVYVETTTDSGIMIRLAKAAFGDSFTITFKAGFSLIRNDGEKIYVSEDITYSYANSTLSRAEKYTLAFEGVETREVIGGQTIGELPEVPAKDGSIAAGWAIDGVEITADTIYSYGADKTAQPIYLQQYTLSFEGLDTTITVTSNMPIGELPDVPENGSYEGVWTIDGEEITVNTIYTYSENKTATASYSKDITKYLALEDRTSWGACSVGGEFYFGVLDLREENKVVGSESETYYLNTNATGCWYHGNNAPITANGGVDIMEYIYINDTSARALITANVNGSQLVNGCGCWLSNPAASPVYVETTNGSGIMIKVLQAYAGDYFEITLKSGFSLINSAGIRVYLTEDVTYKYIVLDGNTTFAKGELTDDDLDQLNGQQITLMNGNEVYLEKKTCRLTLPEIAPITTNELAQVLLGWTTDLEGLSNLYPAGYVFTNIDAEMTLHAVWISFDMQDGAAVRSSKDSSGIRFLVDILQADFNTYYFDNEIISTWGVLLTPTDYLSYVSKFTHSELGANCIDQDCSELWRVEDEAEAIWTYAAAFTNISEYQFARSFSARGYLKVNFTSGEGYVYTPYIAENNARSIYEVSLSAYNDENNPAYKTNAIILNYINNVANITWSADDYSFVRSDVAGDYEITSISVDEGSYTVTVKVDGDITSAVVNGARLSSGSSSNVKMGDFIFNVSGFVKTADGFQFTIGAANATYDKESKDSLHFESSNADLDFFLNDYFKRHSGVVEDSTNLKVNSVTAGVDSEEFFSHEWMSMSYYWYNSFEGYTNEQGNNSDRIAGLRDFLSTVPVDDYGYVWSSNDRVRDTYTEVETGEQKMGWPFPNNDTVSTAHWEFNGDDTGSWSSNVSASTSGGLYNANVSGQSSNITFTSNSFKSYTSKKIYTFYAPLLEFEVRIDDATNVEDIYVWYSTSSSTSFSEDKKLSVKDKAFMSYDLGNASGAYNHILYLPMYAESAWGESTSTYVKQLKIEIVLKSGATISGNVGLNYVRPTLDTRMTNNNSILISSLRTDYDYTGDLDYLTANITRARKAMNLLMQMYDSTRGLKKESYLVGHGGTKEDLNWLGQATNKSIASSMSQGYWDIMYMPEYDFQSNMYFYKAVRDLAYLEDVLADNGITVDASLATIKTATRSRTTGTCAYNYDLSSVADTVLTNLRQTTEDTNHTGFWDAADGRFLAGYASGEGKWYDYGYVAWNLEAIYYGIATEEQATAIMNWLESESSLYDYVFAPRSNTVSGTDMLNGEYAAMKGDWDFGDNCQYGGAIMYTSFYDLMARIDTNGADDAFARLTAIQNWYKEVYDYYEANGTDPYDFYRYYYDNKGIQCQGMGTAGSVGLDREFLESFLPVSAVAYGFFGIEANGNALEVAPELPADLTMWSMENLAFNFVKYDLTIYENAIQLNNVRGDVTGLTLTVALDYTAGQTIYVNGKAVEADKTENGKAYVTIDFGATIVEVR